MDSNHCTNEELSQFTNNCIAIAKTHDEAEHPTDELPFWGVSPNDPSITGDDSLSQPSCLRLPSPPTETEARLNCCGISSQPFPVARSTTAVWKASNDQESLKPKKSFAPHSASEHLHGVWDTLASDLHLLLNKIEVEWTSINCIYKENKKEGNKKHAPVVLIGVMPGSLCGNKEVEMVSQCLELLKTHNITDVDVEIGEFKIVPC